MTEAPTTSTAPAKKMWKIRLASILLYGVARLLLLTYRIRVVGAEERTKAEAMHAGGSFCLALWHEQLFASILAHRGQKFAPLASLSADGDIVTRVMARFGFQTVRGSSSRGGPEARDQLVHMTKDGWFTAITVDGPRGPRRRVKGGIVDLARRTGVSIVPLTSTADRQWVLRSWDQFKIPKPFARILVRYGEPIAVAAETQGLAFGSIKNQIREGLAINEAQAVAELSAWH
ncbi:MAG: DUF374 domain-containing protein [Deltaproteobacteria bacterium]|nr:DUF374 domain-containing protein [Deltaproteobacteria bacterium]